jgi:hypothetical protein
VKKFRHKKVDEEFTNLCQDSGVYQMDDNPEKDILENTEAASQERAEQLSPQGIASIQGEDTIGADEASSDTNPDVNSPPADPNPPPEHWPQTTDGTEKGGASKIETGVEKREKEIFTYKDNEIGSLKHKPSGGERGG